MNKSAAAPPKSPGFDYYNDNSQVGGPASVTTGSGSTADTLLYSYDAVGNLVTVARQLKTPVVSSFSPTSGTVPVTITLTGSNFSGVSAVKIGSASVSSFTVQSSSKITAQLNSTVASGLVSVTNGAGTGTSATSFTVNGAPASLPTISAITPNAAYTGDTVTVSGTNFTGATSVGFVNSNGGTTYGSSGYTVTSSTQLSAPIPTNPTTGNYKVKVCTSAGCGTSTVTVSITNHSCGGCVPQVVAPQPETQTDDSQSLTDSTTGYGTEGTTSIPPSTVINTSLLTYTYSGDNRLRGATLIGQSGQANLGVNFSYNTAGDLISNNYPGITGTLTYNSQGNLSTLQYAAGATVLRRITYGYDYASKGYLSSRTETGPSGTVPTLASSQSFTYNNVGELTAMTSPGGNYSNILDADGNPTSVTYTTGGTASMTYQSGTNRRITWNNIPAVYDANGNLTAETGYVTYTWNARNQLVSVTDVRGINLSYVYDALGRRIAKTYNGVTTKYIYSGEQVIEETTNSLTKRYLVGLGLDTVYASRENGVDEYLLHDALNNSVVAVLAGGSVPSVKTGYAYAPYGQDQATNTNSKNNLKFGGREQECGWLAFRIQPPRSPVSSGACGDEAWYSYG